MSGWPEIVAKAEAVVEVLAVQSLLSVVVVVVGLALAHLMRGRHPKLLSALWLVVMLRLLLPADLGLPMSGLSLVSGMAEWLERQAAETQAMGSLPLAPVSWAAASDSTPAPTQPPWWPVPLMLLWTVGVLVQLRRRGREGRRRARLQRRAARICDPEIERLLERWQSRFGIRRRVRVYAMAGATAPCTGGVLRPRVWIPHALLERPALLETALAHELAHVARWDALWVPLLELCQLLYFFNPLVWLAGARLVHERERACDRLVLDRSALPHRTYAHHLLDLAALGPAPRFATALSHDVRRMTMRIDSILKASSQREPSARSNLLCLSFLILLMVPMLATVTPATGEMAELEVTAGPASAAAVASRQMHHPLPAGRLTAPYGDWKDPFTGKPAFHRGVDLAAPEGTEIVAAAAGRVTVATTDYEKVPAAGTVIRIDHGAGVASVYTHLSRVQVAPGEEVEAGQVIGLVGSTGKSTGPHLHFEVWVGDEHRDPGDFVAPLR